MPLSQRLRAALASEPAALSIEADLPELCAQATIPAAVLVASHSPEVAGSGDRLLRLTDGRLDAPHDGERA